MVKIRHANYVFLSWKGDHSPRHLHVYRNGGLVLKWDLDHNKAMSGKPTKRLLAIIEHLVEKGCL